MPVQLWAHYIQQASTAHRIAVEDSVLLLFSLKNFIHALKMPKSFPKGRTRWESFECDTLGNGILGSTPVLVLSEKAQQCSRKSRTVSFVAYV